MMIRIWLFFVLFASFTYSAFGWNNTNTITTNNDVLLQFRVNKTQTVSCPNYTVCANPSTIGWNISLGGIPVKFCNERCHLLFFVHFGTHTPGVAPGSIFSAASYTSTRDLYRFMDLLNNWYPYILGYEFDWAYGGFSEAGGFPDIDLSNATIHDITLTINSFTATVANVSGSSVLNLYYDLTFTVLGNWHPNLTNITALPTGDAFVRNGTAFANTNYGSLDYLLVSENFSDPSATRYAYFEFDLFSWTVINKATLKLWGSALDNATIAAIAYSVNGTFNESTITWANKPPLNLTASLFPTEINSTVRWYEFDITPLVREEFPHGNGTIYFALVSYYGGAMRFSSREGPFPPRLEIIAVVPEDQQQALPPLFSIVTPPPPPSPTPTTTPVRAPTTTPTVTTPVRAPTTTPTVTTPVRAPTTTPTATTPTATPVRAPTTTPSTTPVRAPTTAPTATPVRAPTTTPTATPVRAPTTAPTATPVTAPTTTPTTTPVRAPTATPTATPVRAPTTAPTTTPVRAPTATPTTTPVRAPTATPTTTPVRAPTATPTTAPVRAPTTTPTGTTPTTTPVRAPTTTPTGQQPQAQPQAQQPQAQPQAQQPQSQPQAQQPQAQPQAQQPQGQQPHAQPQAQQPQAQQPQGQQPQAQQPQAQQPQAQQPQGQQPDQQQQPQAQQPDQQQQPQAQQPDQQQQPQGQQPDQQQQPQAQQPDQQQQPQSQQQPDQQQQPQAKTSSLANQPTVSEANVKQIGGTVAALALGWLLLACV